MSSGIYRPPRVKKGIITIGKGRKSRKKKDREFVGPTPIEKAFPLAKNPWELPGQDYSWGDEEDQESSD